MKNLFINGEWVEPISGDSLDIYNPGTGKVIDTIGFGNGADTAKAIDAAAKAFPVWSNLTVNERSAYLRRVSDLIMENLEDLAKTVTLETGKPLSEAKAETLRASENFLWYSEEAKRINGETLPSNVKHKRLMVLKQPIGVVGAITPWNIPLNMIARKLGPALAAGCTVVLKPAESTPLNAIKIFELFKKAGMPDGVVNLIIGEPVSVGKELLENRKVKKITFTGSTRVGKYLMEKAAQQVKNISLELGGHAPFIVFEDANLDAAIDGLFLTKFQNNGQMCISANGIYVHEDVIEEFSEKLVSRLKDTKVGQGEDEDTQIGPVINEVALNRILDQVTEAVGAGAQVLYGGERITTEGYSEGYFVRPTVMVNVDKKMRVAHEETFGPVAPLISFKTEEEVIEMANDTDYGLAGYFYTQNIRRTYEVAEKLEFGIIGVNDGWPIQIHTPFTGHKESGIGVEGGYYALHEFLETKLITHNIEEEKK